MTETQGLIAGLFLLFALLVYVKTFNYLISVIPLWALGLATTIAIGFLSMVAGTAIDILIVGRKVM